MYGELDCTGVGSKLRFAEKSGGIALRLYPDDRNQDSPGLFCTTAFTIRANAEVAGGEAA